MQTTVLITIASSVLATLVGVSLLNSTRQKRQKKMTGDVAFDDESWDFSEPVRNLAKNFAHDVNNYIAIILLSAERMQLTAAADQPATADQREAIEQIIQACDSCRMLNQQIQAIGGDQFLKLSRNDLANTLKTNRSRFEFLTDNRNWLFIKTADSLYCEVDTEALLTAVDCLIKNANQSCHESEIGLNAFRKELDDRGEIWIEVTNPKLDPSTQISDRCIEPYYSTDPLRRGLGLTYATSIANNHGGRISIQNEDPDQTRVSIIIPVQTFAESSEA